MRWPTGGESVAGCHSDPCTQTIQPSWPWSQRHTRNQKPIDASTHHLLEKSSSVPWLLSRYTACLHCCKSPRWSEQNRLYEGRDDLQWKPVDTNDCWHSYWLWHWRWGSPFETSEYSPEHFYHRSFPVCKKQASYCVDQIVCFIMSQGSLLYCLIPFFY